MADVIEVLNNADVAPEMFVHVELFGDDCHWYVTPDPGVAF